MKNIGRLVAQLLEKYEANQPPIDVELIAEKRGATIARQHFVGAQSGFSLREGNNWVIGVNTATSRRRQRFTIAHELGHLLLHEGQELIVDHAVRISWRDQKSSMATDQQEIEANSFAAQLLMPRELLWLATRRAVEGGTRTRDALVTRLADEFDVSTEAMGYRLVNLGIVNS